MQSLLRWSVENSEPQGDDGDAQPPPPLPPQRQDLDPDIINYILGKPDAQQMKEDLALAKDTSKSDVKRAAALDHLEELVERIDNANDLQRLGLWEPLQSLLTEETSTTNIKVNTLWTIGTAVQNNPAAQDVYMSLDPLPLLVSFLEPSWCPSSAVRAKALYVLSGLLRHNAPAVAVFGTPEINGWPKLRDSLHDPDISVRKRAISIIGTLMKPSLLMTNAAGPPRGLISTSTSSSVSPDTTALNIMTPNDQPPTADQVHANSHAANLRNSSRVDTAQLVLDAVREYQILEYVIASIINPLPHGEDGQFPAADLDYEETAIRLVYTYTVTCATTLSTQQKSALSFWIQNAQEEAGVASLLDKLGLTKEEYLALVEKLKQ